MAASFAPYNPDSDTWNSYLARFNIFLESNDLAEITDNKKRALFLCCCGPEMFRMARILLSPVDIKSVSWDVLQSTLRDHYAPRLTQMASRYIFYHRNQAEGESIYEYVAALQEAALNCEFKDSLSEVLLDRVIGGMRDVVLQQRLLAKTDLTLQMALKEAYAAEMSNRSIAKIQKSNRPPASRKPATVRHEDANCGESEDEDNVNCLRYPKGRNVATEKWQPACAGCGGNHLRKVCRFKNAICYRCEKIGHLARVCRANQLTSPKRMQKK